MHKYTLTQFSVFSSESIEESILGNYQIQKPYKCWFFQLGLNDTYIVKSEMNNYYLRLYAYGWRTKTDIEAEVYLLEYLYNAGISVSKPIRNNEGRYLNEINAPEGIRYAVLFTDAIGICNNNPNEKQNYLIGDMIAKMHNCADKACIEINRFHIDLHHLVTEPLDQIKPYLVDRIYDFEYLVSIAESLKYLINKLLTKGKPEYGICHGDFHHGNIHFINDNATLYDFDCFGYGWRAYDLAVYHWLQVRSEKPSDESNTKQKQWEDFLRGYTNERNLNEYEYKAINVFIAIRHIWLLGLHAKISSRFGCSWINNGYIEKNIEFIKKWIRDSNILL